MREKFAVLRLSSSHAVKVSKVRHSNSVAEGQVRLLLTARRGIE